MILKGISMDPQPPWIHQNPPGGDHSITQTMRNRRLETDPDPDLDLDLGVIKTQGMETDMNTTRGLALNPSDLAHRTHLGEQILQTPGQVGPILLSMWIEPQTIMTAARVAHATTPEADTVAGTNTAWRERAGPDTHPDPPGTTVAPTGPNLPLMPKIMAETEVGHVSMDTTNEVASRKAGTGNVILTRAGTVTGKGHGTAPNRDMT